MIPGDESSSDAPPVRAAGPQGLTLDKGKLDCSGFSPLPLALLCGLSGAPSPPASVSPPCTELADNPERCSFGPHGHHPLVESDLRVCFSFLPLTLSILLPSCASVTREESCGHFSSAPDKLKSYL